MSAIDPIRYLALQIREASENPTPHGGSTAYLKLVEALQAVKVGSLKFDDSTKLLIFLTQCCSKIGSPPAVLEAVLQRWSIDHNDVDGVIADLASMISVPAEVLTYVCQTLRLTSTLYGILETTIKNRKGRNIAFALTANRLITAFKTTPAADPDDSLHIWDNLLQVVIRTEKPKNGDAYQYITEKLGRMSRPVPRPKWVNVLEGETLQLLRKTPTDSRPSSDIVGRVVQKIESQIAVSQRSSAVSEGELLTSEEPSNLSEMIEMYVSTSIPEELELLDEYSNSRDESNIGGQPNEHGSQPSGMGGPRSDEGPWNVIGRPERLWGPVNAMLDRDCSVSKGPCRMLSCICRDLDQACDEELNSCLDPEQWFTGRCDECQRSLVDVSYAIRFPVTNGGWVGCFCSWSCLRQNPPRPLFTEEATAINRVKAVIEQFGILDRGSAPR